MHNIYGNYDEPLFAVNIHLYHRQNKYLRLKWYATRVFFSGGFDLVCNQDQLNCSIALQSNTSCDHLTNMTTVQSHLLQTEKVVCPQMDLSRTFQVALKWVIRDSMCFQPKPGQFLIDVGPQSTGLLVWNLILKSGDCLELKL